MKRGANGRSAEGDDTTFDVARPDAARPATNRVLLLLAARTRLTARARAAKITGFPTGSSLAASAAGRSMSRRHAPVVSTGGRSSVVDDASRGR